MFVKYTHPRPHLKLTGSESLRKVLRNLDYWPMMIPGDTTICVLKFKGLTSSLGDVYAQLSLRTTTYHSRPGITVTTYLSFKSTEPSSPWFLWIYSISLSCLPFPPIQHTHHVPPLQPSRQFQFPCPNGLPLSSKTPALEQFNCMDIFSLGLIGLFILSLKFCSKSKVFQSLHEVIEFVCLIHDHLPLRSSWLSG